MKILLIITGWILVALGVIGIFLPLMPTTIFLILAAAAFAKSSDRLYNWLINNKYLGKYIRDYREQRGMPLRAKIMAIIMLNLTIGYSALFVIEKLYVQIILFVIAISVTIYLISLKTIREPHAPTEEA
ncbi:MAG: YbaN family protein [Melioribacteraceae bacterium]|nr:YbaN family protein [Melioribacteraceae bacterium]MCF8354906.1 YbaN family protein [Melioribacteraceae bacterium]MCF8396037.1 YbaN family protein [Melioribacteraceae bacterium]MCF8421058.1 YbaN family protein [Melioribacteraceae bacterium]